MNQRYTVTIVISIKVHSNILFLSFLKRFKNKMHIDFASWKKLSPFPKAKIHIGSQSLPLSKHSHKYQGGVCGESSHRVVTTVPYLVTQRFRQVALQKFRTSQTAPQERCSVQKGHLL